MEDMVKKYQQKFRKVKEEMSKWEEFQSFLLSQFNNASSIIQILKVIQDSKNYGMLRCVEGIEIAVTAKQMESLQNILLSMNKTMENFHGLVSSMEEIVRDSGQLTAQTTKEQLQQRVGLKPSLANCSDNLRELAEMHRSEYHLKLSIVSALPELALEPSSACDDLRTLQRLLVDQPNIPMVEVQQIFDIIFAEEIC